MMIFWIFFFSFSSLHFFRKVWETKVLFILDYFLTILVVFLLQVETERLKGRLSGIVWRERKDDEGLIRQETRVESGLDQGWKIIPSDVDSSGLTGVKIFLRK